MLYMTENQKKLLRFINNYRLKHAGSPTLREMVKGIGVSDNKSILGIIKSLAEQGYLVKQEKKSRGVFLTDKALKFLRISIMPIKYKKEPSILDKLKHPDDLTRNSVTVSLPVTESLSYGDKSFKTDGTNLDESIISIVESAVNQVLSSYLNGSSSVKNSKYAILNSQAALLLKILSKESFLKKMEWGLLSILILAFSILLIGKNIFALITSVVLVFLIFIVYNLSKE